MRLPLSRRGVVFFTIAAVTLAASSGMAATILVPAEQPTIQAGIEAAFGGDLILVSPGTYVENIDFLGKGITVQSEVGPDLTVIDGNQAGSVVTLNSFETLDTVIDGFTIRNGKASDGGGIYCSVSSPTITNCTISENTAISGRGGGIRCSGSSPTITNCTISGNIATYTGGGGIYCSGSSPTIMNCTISGNSSGFWGGGIYCSGSSPMITNCTISGNSADDAGGGIYCDSSSPTIANCTISGNSADDDGGGIYCGDSSPTITNCTISGNSAADRGGGIYCYSFSPTITNCSLWGDSAPDGPEIYSSESLVVEYSDVGGGYPGIGNIDADPLFMGAKGQRLGGYDFRLSPGSPCIDVGNPNASYSDVCLPPSMGSERNDMGAYGGPEACGWCGDHDGDGYDSATCGGDDCDDMDTNTYPGADEICDGKDNDCDGSIPGDELDTDEDGWMTCEGDCDDLDSQVNPDVAEGLAAENCENGIDDDCDGLIDTDPQCESAIYVPAEYPTIQEGIDAAVDGVLILVAPGTYVENINFLGKAITVRGEAGAEVTIIDGNENGLVVTFNSGETEGAVLDGFTIRNGFDFLGDGGGILCYNSSPTITNCTISGNRVHYHSYGGGIYCFRSSPTITDCIISGNLSTQGSGGGGIYCDSSSPTITNCTISGNSADDCGGGIHCHHSSPTITNCTISGNTALRGGGIYCSSSFPTITNCAISGNCAILGNSAGDGRGGGIYCYSSSPTITNCILWGDLAPSGAEIYVYSGSPVVTYSDVQGGRPGTGNIDEDPLFVGGGDYHLASGSPCIDAGNPDLSYNDVCFPPSMGTERNDMGVYGGPGACGWPLAVYGDLGPLGESDGKITSADFNLSVNCICSVLDFTGEETNLLDIAPVWICNEQVPIMAAPNPDGKLDMSDVSVLLQVASGYLELVPYCP